MALLLYVASIVLCVLAAVLGWSFGPHHSFALLAIGVGCLAAALITPLVVQRAGAPTG